MKATAVRVLKRVLVAVVTLLIVVFAWRAYDALRAPHLARWHTFKPHEASAEQIAKLDWAGYVDT
jgi:cytochrome c-type biogenesis protein CcmH/NrfG